MHPLPLHHREELTVESADRQIPFHRASVGEDEVQAVSEVIRSGWLTMGPKTVEFEAAFARYVRAEHAIAVSSCTAALHLALEAVGVGAGDEVLVPTNTFTATAEVVTYLGAKPVLVDVDPLTLNLDAADAVRCLTSRTRAIIPVHFAGQPSDMTKISEVADTHGLHVIEDAAHALPASHRGSRVGSLSVLTAFSFYATKPMTTGEGGMVTTGNADYAERMRIMRLHGIGRDAWKRYSAEGSWRYEVVAAGFKYNMTDIQAALGLVQLGKCDAMYRQRARIAARYTSSFQQIEALEPPAALEYVDPSWHLYVLRLHLDRLKMNRSDFIDELRRRGVGTSVHFIPLHLHPYYQSSFGYRVGDCPVAEREYQRCVSLPIYPDMTDEDVQRVIEVVAEVCELYRV
ncbi:MAG: DegT/DnrJ/EryC1/StrS aminotransferase family protein [Candidatus Acidiferrales bacterium]